MTKNFRSSGAASVAGLLGRLNTHLGVRRLRRLQEPTTVV
jgi:hypothetical protein